MSCTSHETAFWFEVLFARWKTSEIRWELSRKEPIMYDLPLSFLVVASIQEHVFVAALSQHAPYTHFDYPVHYCVVLKSITKAICYSCLKTFVYNIWLTCSSRNAWTLFCCRYSKSWVFSWCFNNIPCACSSCCCFLLNSCKGKMYLKTDLFYFCQNSHLSITVFRDRAVISSFFGETCAFLAQCTASDIEVAVVPLVLQPI